MHIRIKPFTDQIIALDVNADEHIRDVKRRNSQQTGLTPEYFFLEPRTSVEVEFDKTRAYRTSVPHMRDAVKVSLCSENRKLTGTTTYDATSAILTFTPDSPLIPDAAYTVEVTAQVQIGRGEGVEVPYQWTFRTAPTFGPVPASSIASHISRGDGAPSSPASPHGSGPSSSSRMTPSVSPAVATAAHASHTPPGSPRPTDHSTKRIVVIREGHAPRLVLFNPSVDALERFRLATCRALNIGDDNAVQGFELVMAGAGGSPLFVDNDDLLQMLRDGDRVLLSGRLPTTG